MMQVDFELPKTIFYCYQTYGWGDIDIFELKVFGYGGSYFAGYDVNDRYLEAPLNNCFLTVEEAINYRKQLLDKQIQCLIELKNNTKNVVHRLDENKKFKWWGFRCQK